MIQRHGDVLVLVDEGRGTEVVMQVQDAARLAVALPYLLTGAVGVQDIGAERIRQLSAGHSRSADLAGGLDHVLDMVKVARAHLLTAGAQVRALASDTETAHMLGSILQGHLQPPQEYPASWRWTPDVDPQVNLKRAGALTAAVMDALAVYAAMGMRVDL